MARIKKIQENGSTIYPVTIPQAIKDPTTNKTLNEKFNEYVSKFDTEASINGSLTVRNLNIDGYTEGIKFENKPVDEDPKFWLDDGTRKSIKELNIAEQDKEYKKLTSGFAYEIVGDDQSTSEKFSFRPTGGPNRNVRDGSARIEALKGNSVVWNQQCNKKWAISQNNGSDSPQSLLIGGIGTYVKTLEGHKVYMVATSTSNSGTTFYINLFQSIDINGTGAIFTYTNPNSAYIGLYATIPAHTEINTEVTLLIHDLTQMFGEEIANTINTVGQFYEMMPIVANPAAYNEGEIVDANYKAIKTTGFNQFNGTYAKVLGGVKYYLGGTYTSVGYTTEEGGTTEAITIPSDKFYTPSQNGYIYAQGTDICINIAWDEYSALNGTYKPYKPFERDLSWANKYFPATINGETKYGMRSAGNVADEIRFNSTTQQWEAVQRIGVVDLGSLTWGYGMPTGSYELFYTSANSIENALYYGGGVLPNAISELYMPVTANLLSANGENNTFTLFNSNKRMMVRNTSYTDAATFKAAMQGVMLNYELVEPIVTPITEDINLAYDVADYGTEQLIVADGAQSAPLSAEIVYKPNVLASIKQVAAMLTRLDALETAVATMQASAVATTNEE